MSLIMASSDSSHISLGARCLCGAHSFSVPVPRSSLPLQGKFCHCTSCRRMTGALYSSMVNWPGPVEEVTKSSLTAYEFTSLYRILFCKTCSSPMFWWGNPEAASGTLGAFTGVLEHVNESNLIEFTDHIFLEDTVDGGAVPWLRRISGNETRCWMRTKTGQEIGQDWPHNTQLRSANDKEGPQSYSIECRCKGVKFTLRRGDAEFANMAPEDLPFFIDPTTYKHLASFDACNSCRMMFGVDFVNWTFALLQQIDFGQSTDDSGSSAFPRTTQELKKAVLVDDRDSRLGTLSMYASSEDVQRYFCSVCSATIFYAVDDRPDLVDVAIGVVDAPEGARAESLLVWGLGSSIGGTDDVKGSWREGMMNHVRHDAEQWRIERGYPKSWRRVAAEQAQA